MPLRHLMNDSFFSLFMDAMGESFAHHQILRDEQGIPIDYRILFINQAYEHTTGLTKENVIGKTIKELEPDVPDDWISLCAEVALTGTPQSVERYIPHLDKFFRISIFSHLPDDFSTLFVDITEAKAAEEVSRRYRNLLENSPDIVLFVNRSGTIVDANHTAVNTYGYERDELIGSSITKLRTSASLGNFIEQFDKAASCGIRFETEHQRKDGSVFPVEVSSKSASQNGEALLMSIIRDISIQKHHECQIHNMATHDHLTGIFNRVGFYERIAQMVDLATRESHKLAVLYFDLNGFKGINDQFGHETGDLILQSFADRILPIVRSNDLFGRLGGDEFALVLSYIHTETDVELVLDKIINSLEIPLYFGNTPIQIESSVGIAMYPDHSTNYLQLLQYADSAMYDSKRSAGSGTTYTFYSGE